MKVFVLKKNHGVVVIQANSRQEAFQLLLKREHPDFYFTHNLTESGLTEVDPDKSEIITYYAT